MTAHVVAGENGVGRSGPDADRRGRGAYLVGLDDGPGTAFDQDARMGIARRRAVVEHRSAARLYRAAGCRGPADQRTAVDEVAVGRVVFRDITLERRVLRGPVDEESVAAVPRR